jgi:4-diphosphocytidyl-2-C-methyl-D-erythritol kinase
MIRDVAPAKINLYLHVGPVRADGLHDIASLFVFTETGDDVLVDAAPDLSLTIKGAFAPSLEGFDINENLVMRAARALQDKTGVYEGAALTLSKNLPVAAGVGGGSADAAAALRALMRHWNVSLPSDALNTLAFSLGADVPACLDGRPVLVDGAGERLSPAPPLPDLYACLVNPRVDMPTGPVFRQFDSFNLSPQQPDHGTADPTTLDGVRRLMAETRNDLQGPAVAIAPVVGDVVRFLESQPAALAARMSGSGATCFAIFARQEEAEVARLAAREKGWWAMASKLASG